MKKTYELVVLFNPTLASDLLKKAEEDISKFISSKKGTIKKTEDWGRKMLQYPIGKHTEAVYVFYQVELDPEHAQALDRAVQLHDSVIRHIVVLSKDNA